MWNKAFMELALNPRILVEYKAKTSQRGLKVLLALSPFWALWAPWMIIWLLQAIIVGEMYNDLSMLFLVFLFLSVIASSIFTVFVCRENKFIITKDGIKFPLRCLFEMKNKLYRPWTELDAMNFVDESLNSIDSEEPDTINLHFEGGADLPLSLESFKKEDLQSFLLAVQSYRPQLPVSPPLSQVRLGITVDNTAQKALSFTQIWEDDMASRFGSTVFVPLEPGALLKNKRLEILGQIAFGGLSAVYLAKNDSEALCVIKEAVVPASAEQASREKALEMFAREAKIMMALNHPRIASVIDSFVEDGRHYLQLEYIDDKDLRRFVREKGPQSEIMVLRFACEILELLDYLHSQNPPVLHRDLTPDNLVLEADGSVSLIDFGAANEFLGTATGTLVGKQSYISPEQFRGKASVQSDLYSLGATLYFLLCAEDPDALSESHPKEKISELSFEIDAFVAELTALDLEKRISTAKLASQKAQDLLKLARSKSPKLVNGGS